MEYFITTKKDALGLYVLTLKEHMDLWKPIKNDLVVHHDTIYIKSMYTIVPML